jgi:hypothetical protein
MVGMVATLAIVDFCRLGIASVITTRFVILVAIVILAVLAWRIAMVLATILMSLLIRPITVSVFVVSVLTINAVGESVPVLASRFLGRVIFFGLLFALQDLGEYAAAHTSVVSAFEELMKFEHVIFDHSVLLRILDEMRLWLSKENLFA